MKEPSRTTGISWIPGYIKTEWNLTFKYANVLRKYIFKDAVGIFASNG